MCCRNNIAVSSLTAAAMAKATVGFNDWNVDRQKATEAAADVALTVMLLSLPAQLR